MGGEREIKKEGKGEKKEKERERRKNWVQAVYYPCLIFVLETGSYYLALDDLELTMYNRLASNSSRSDCFCLQSAESKTRGQSEIVLNLKEK